MYLQRSACRALLPSTNPSESAPRGAALPSRPSRWTAGTALLLGRVRVRRPLGHCQTRLALRLASLVFRPPLLWAVAFNPGPNLCTSGPARRQRLPLLWTASAVCLSAPCLCCGRLPSLDGGGAAWGLRPPSLGRPSTGSIHSLPPLRPAGRLHLTGRPVRRMRPPSRPSVHWV